MPRPHLRRFPRVKDEFIVEFIFNGQSYTARATILGGAGLFIKTAQELPRDATLTLSFRPAKHLPRIEARAIVRSTAGHEGVGVEFTSMRPEDHQKILKFILRRMKDQRQGPRAPFVAQVQYEGGTFLGLSTDISAGGIFVETKELPPVGAKLELRFHLDDGDSIVDAKGEVVYIVEKLGIGVHFIGLSEGDQERIEEYVSKGAAKVAL